MARSRGAACTRSTHADSTSTRSHLAGRLRNGWRGRKWVGDRGLHLFVERVASVVKSETMFFCCEIFVAQQLKNISGSIGQVP